MKFWKMLQRQKIAPKELANGGKKSSQVGSMVACNFVGRPMWTPRNYAALSEHGYRKNVIVHRCVNLIARGAASVPWRLYKGRDELETHPLLRLLNRPSVYQGGSAFFESVFAHLLLSGNSYIERVLGRHAAEPRELYALRPDRVKVVPGPTGLPIGFEYSVNGKALRLKLDPATGQSPILHLKLFNPLNDWYGQSPIEAAACAIDQHNAVADHNLALLQNGGRPSGALMVNKTHTGHNLSAEQVEDLRKDLRTMVEGEENAGRVLLLEGDFHWQEMGLSPKDLDFVEGKFLSAREIAQAFNVPPMLVGIPGDSTFTNYREARFHLWEDTILPLLDYVVDELNLWLAPQFEPGLRLSYDIDAIPALAPRREEAWAKIAKADFLTINEKRKMVGYAPLTGGDTVQQQGGKGE
jgi:phage portal protein, HK97 family